MSQNKQPNTPKLPALPLLSSCSISEDSAVRLYICVKSEIQELCQYWSSSAQLSPTSSVKTPPEPCSYYKLLILWFLQIPLQRQKHGHCLTVLKIFYFSVSTTMPTIKTVLSCQRQISPPPDSSAPNFRKHIQGLTGIWLVSQEAAYIHPKLSKCHN